VVPALARLGRRGAEARELMEYYWETIEQCVPPERILAALEEAGFSTVERDVDLAVFSSYRGVA
jgi:demethylmenaquinone methyltransferase/2-methoxy-6-polyprenyl-1,4-benzoquinol methylase